MVAGVITRMRGGARAAADDSPAAAVFDARRRHSVFVIIAARLSGQLVLAIAEYDAVAVIAKRSIGLDTGEQFAGFGRQRALRNVTGRLRRARIDCRAENAQHYKRKRCS